MPLNYGETIETGDLLEGVLALSPAVITAGAGNDGVEVNGPAIDRLASGRPLARSGTLFVFGTTTLAEDETLTLSSNFQTDDVSAFNTSPADLSGGVVAATVVATGGTGGSTEIFVKKVKVDLSEGLQYVRAQVTLALSAGATDTCNVGAVLVLSGATNVPAP